MNSLKWIAHILSGGSFQEFVFYADSKEEADLKIRSIFPGLQYKIKEDKK
jgi:hypothetical protein